LHCNVFFFLWRRKALRLIVEVGETHNLGQYLYIYFWCRCAITPTIGNIQVETLHATSFFYNKKPPRPTNTPQKGNLHSENYYVFCRFGFAIQIIYPGIYNPKSSKRHTPVCLKTFICFFLGQTHRSAPYVELFNIQTIM